MVVLRAMLKRAAEDAAAIDHFLCSASYRNEVTCNQDSLSLRVSVYSMNAFATALVVSPFVTNRNGLWTVYVLSMIVASVGATPSTFSALTLLSSEPKEM